MALNNKSYILLRYITVSIGIILFSIWVLIFLVRNTVVKAGEWNERAEREMNIIDTIAPERGNIIARNGNILACNVEAINVMIDLRDKRIKDNFKVVPWDEIDALADSLDKYYPRRQDLHRSEEFYQANSWRKRLRQKMNLSPSERPMAMVLAKKVSMADYERINNFPFIKNFIDPKHPKKRTIIFREPCNIRIYPYGAMATRSIGRVSQIYKGKRVEFHGYSGLEKCLDSLLYGKAGLGKKTPMSSGMRSWITNPPQRGLDILSTIDIDMQDMLEEQLTQVCEDAGAYWGTAVLMEVATGEIKAISNVEYSPKLGEYIEALNRATEAVEPGSVMKPISLMIAFEDGCVLSPTSTVDCGPFMRTSDHAGGGTKTMKQVIETSSNTGIARVIFRKYGDHPEKFYDRLESIGFFEPMHSGIADEARPRVARLTEFAPNGQRRTMEARHLDLARQAYGYNTAIPPLYTLSIYNAIANDGRYVRPHLVRGFRLSNGKDSILDIPPIRQSICSPKTAQMVRECIAEVVWGEHGTARAVRDDRVKVAGKTGTAYPYDHEHLKGYDTSKRRFAFCGFFPYENPKYSCIALVLAPAGNSANRTSGQVVKNMALKMYARGMLDNSSRYTDDKVSDSPVVYAGCNVGKIKNTIGNSAARRLKTNKVEAGKMPDLKGYDPAMAINILERSGVNVKLRGRGRVVEQSLQPGAALQRGTAVTLTLKV